ncbi:hypothetical protein, partial [Streptomyces longisporoflavus]|uniref:hypothetical protein n=1 Tax=Streptomyces longisporoflavus TaxID=28044 RepID=UPI0027E48A72
RTITTSPPERQPSPEESYTQLRQAMDRLLAGTPLHTDGALTKENLAREARVSHATLHRAQQILAEWDTRVPRTVRCPAPTAQDTELAELRRRLCTANGRVSTPEGQLDALATVTANLYRENLELKRKATVRPQRRIAALPAPGPWKE